MSDVVLITGAGGFVGRRLVPHLLELLPPAVSFVALDRVGGESDGRLRWATVDVTVDEEVRRIVAETRPTAVIHLAASARTNYGRDEIGGVWKVNLQGTLNVAHAVLELSPGAWLLNISSGMVYGANAGDDPISEDVPAAPQNAYAASKYAAEVALEQLARNGLRFVTARPFNHSGPGQSVDFFVPALIRRVLQHRKTSPTAPFPLRSADHVRDFLHVDDVVSAYARLLQIRDELSGGGVLNISSAQAVTLREIALFALQRASLACVVESEGASSGDDLRSLVGDNRRLLGLGWRPGRDWRGMVDETYSWMDLEPSF